MSLLTVDLACSEFIGPLVRESLAASTAALLEDLRIDSECRPFPLCPWTLRPLVVPVLREDLDFLAVASLCLLDLLAWTLEVTPDLDEDLLVDLLEDLRTSLFACDKLPEAFLDSDLAEGLLVDLLEDLRTSLFALDRLSEAFFDSDLPEVLLEDLLSDRLRSENFACALLLHSLQTWLLLCRQWTIFSYSTHRSLSKSVEVSSLESPCERMRFVN